MSLQLNKDVHAWPRGLWLPRYQSRLYHPTPRIVHQERSFLEGGCTHRSCPGGPSPRYDRSLSVGDDSSVRHAAESAPALSPTGETILKNPAELQELRAEFRR